MQNAVVVNEIENVLSELELLKQESHLHYIEIVKILSPLKIFVYGKAGDFKKIVLFG